MKAFYKAAVCFFLFLGMGVWTFPQTPQARMRNRDRLRENINMLRLLRMTQTLDLSEEQAAAIFPTVNKIEKEKAELQRQLNRTLQDLRMSLRTAETDESEILERVEKVMAIRAGIREKDVEIEDFLFSNLTPVQRGRYLIFVVDFFRGLGENLNRLRDVRKKTNERS